MAAGGPRPSPSGTTPHTATHSLRDGACEETAVPSSTRDRNPEEPPCRDRSGSEHFHAGRPETEPFPATAFPRKHCCHRGRCPEQDSHRPPNSLAPNRWARVPDCQALLRCARLFSVAAERGLRAPSPRYLCLAFPPPSPTGHGAPHHRGYAPSVEVGHFSLPAELIGPPLATYN